MMAAITAGIEAASKVAERTVQVNIRGLPTFDYEKVFWNSLWTEGLYHMAKFVWTFYRGLGAIVGVLTGEPAVKWKEKAKECARESLDAGKITGEQHTEILSMIDYPNAPFHMMSRWIHDNHIDIWDCAQTTVNGNGGLTTDSLTVDRVLDEILINQSGNVAVGIPVAHATLEASRMKKLFPGKRRYKIAFVGGIAFLGLMVFPKLLELVPKAAALSRTRDDVDPRDLVEFDNCDVNGDGVVDEADIRALERNNKLFTASQCRKKFIPGTEQTTGKALQ